MTRALVLIDAQSGFFAGDFEVYQAEAMRERFQALLKWARDGGTPIIYVRHVEALEYDGDIDTSITPQSSEPVVDKMTPDSFHNTTLQETLQAKGITDLIIAGFQTEMCIDTTTRRAKSMEYNVTLVSDAHSTPAWDGMPVPPEKVIAHHNAVLTNFATVKTSAQVMAGE
ncbi:MAG: cysteine hydrolase family protein [Aggregatilineales bacterium]